MVLKQTTQLRASSSQRLERRVPSDNLDVIGPSPTRNEPGTVVTWWITF